jgi:hypothetical protein
MNYRTSDLDDATDAAGWYEKTIVSFLGYRKARMGSAPIVITPIRLLYRGRDYHLNIHLRCCKKEFKLLDVSLPLAVRKIQISRENKTSHN